ncbi:hypothetical protein EK599_13755 [Vibrio sp. T187]|uniref:hypothetical protein n=1 Tax=Vibrio TaxID=662 RepID=UPI0010C990B1|nr:MULTISPECIES: hypothetical protein [Vibrio]MBW3696759.1 hypothetical protein [Vibrio sp. T187]
MMSASPIADNYPLTPLMFEKIIEELTLFNLNDLTLLELSELVFTFNGRQDSWYGEKAISQLTSIIISKFGNTPLAKKQSIANSNTTSLNICLTKLGILNIVESNTDLGDNFLYSTIFISNDEFDAIKGELSLIDAVNVNYAQEVDSFYANSDKNDIVDKVIDLIDHTDPAMYIFDQQLIANYPPYNNLFSRTGNKDEKYLIELLQNQTTDEWAQTHRTFIYCLYCIANSGFKCEEFSGIQLTPSTLARWLDEKIASRLELLALTESTKPNTLLERAKYLFELKQLLRSDYFSYRIVNGLNVNKTEHVMPRNTIDISMQRLPKGLTAAILQKYGCDYKDADSVDSYFRQVVHNIHSANPEVAASETLNLIRDIVLECVDELNADYGMTRAPRDLHSYSTLLHTGDYAQLCDLPISEYFTAVFSSKKFEAYFQKSPKILSRILNAVASRMCFNSWHYTPGQCPQDRIPEGRHFYYPPKMADFDFRVSHRQKGHQMAYVNHSIRSPAGIIVNGVKRYGIIDMRIVRVDEQLFTQQDLVRVREYTSYVRAIYQSLLDLATDKGCNIRVNEYDKAWYDNYSLNLLGTN